MRTRLLASVAMACMATAAFAQPSPSGNLERLSNFKTTGASMDIPTTPQTGPKAEAIKKTLSRIKLPPGFKISLYAIVPDARHMAVGPQGVVTFVGTRKNKVYAVTDRDKDRTADEILAEVCGVCDIEALDPRPAGWCRGVRPNAFWKAAGTFARSSTPRRQGRPHAQRLRLKLLYFNSLFLD